MEAPARLAQRLLPETLRQTLTGNLLFAFSQGWRLPFAGSAHFAVAMSFSWLDSWRVWVFFAVEASIVGLANLFACWALGETRGRSLEHVRAASFTLHCPVTGTAAK